MLMSLYIATAVIAYLLGSIPFGYILVRIFHGQDVRQSGSGNIGATNVARSSPALGVVTLLLDAAKGSCAVWSALLIFDATTHGFIDLRLQPMVALAALFAVIGHIFPVWLKFRGGKGVATGVGAFITVAPKAVLFAIVIFLALLAAFRYVSLGSIIAATSLPVLIYFLYVRTGWQTYAITAAAALAVALIIIKHRENILRLVAGTEPRFALKRTRA